MVLAYILINAELGMESQVLEKLNAFPEVREAYMVYGVYDIIVKVEAETVDELKETVFQRIRLMENVRSTLTMMVT